MEKEYLKKRKPAIFEWIVLGSMRGIISEKDTAALQLHFYLARMSLV